MFRKERGGRTWITGIGMFWVLLVVLASLNALATGDSANLVGAIGASVPGILLIILGTVGGKTPAGTSPTTYKKRSTRRAALMLGWLWLVLWFLMGIFTFLITLDPLTALGGAGLWFAVALLGIPAIIWGRRTGY